jgi:hypothetical protein
MWDTRQAASDAHTRSPDCGIAMVLNYSLSAWSPSNTTVLSSTTANLTV